MDYQGNRYPGDKGREQDDCGGCCMGCENSIGMTRGKSDVKYGIVLYQAFLMRGKGIIKP